MMSRKLIAGAVALFLSCFVPPAPAARQQGGVGELPAEVVELLFKNLCEQECSEEETSRWRSDLKFEAHDLNDDADPEFFVFIDHSDWCGAGANCTYWVFQRKAHGYVLIFEEKVLRVTETVTRGYHDLASETPAGFCDVNVQRLDVTVYKYDGEQYRPHHRGTECRPFQPPPEPL